MKTVELTGINLDYWACAAGGLLRATPGSKEFKMGGLSPSTEWRHCGWMLHELLRAGFAIEPCGDEYRCANVSDDGYHFGMHTVEREYVAYGKTPQIAICRAYVASHYGDEVPDEVPA